MPRPCRPIRFFATLAAVLLACGDDRLRGGCEDRMPVIARGFGAAGPYTEEQRSVPNPRWPSAPARVFLPSGAASPVPVVLLAHAYNEADPDRYRALIAHLVSRGNAVVFPPYAVHAATHAERFGALWSGFAAALEAVADQVDLERVGFVGHSYGAGVLPALARRALADRGWGSRGSFLLLMAPWFAVEVEAEELMNFPRHAKLLILVFEDDTANDHRIAIELFESIGVPDTEKDYLMVRSDARAGCDLPAVHTLPLSRGLRARDDALDVFAIFRLVDALAAYAFEGDEAGRRVALGRGSDEQLHMGSWPDGAPRRTLLWSPSPRPAHPQPSYLFRHEDGDAWRDYREPARQ